MGLATAIGLGIAGVGAFASAKSANKASKRAAETSQANTDANVALARDIYGQNKQVLSPFVDRGNAAGNQINALLGLGGSAPAPQTQQVQPNALAQFQGGRPAGFGYGLGDGFIGPGSFIGGGGFNPAALGDMASGGIMPSETYGATLPSAGGAVSSAAQTGQSPQEAANAAFDTFRNSTGYQFRLGEGLDAVNSAYAGIGGLQSGAAMRGITEYGQNFASNEFGNYMNALGAQQAVGAGSASSLAGVGQNFAGTVIGQNNFNAANQMNAQLSRGGNNALGNLAGVIGGGLFQYGIGS